MTMLTRLLLPTSVTLSRSEGSLSIALEMLRGVYPERSECAQHDSAVTHTASWINVFHCMIGPIHLHHARTPTPIPYIHMR
jgi:hypothetical protein